MEKALRTPPASRCSRKPTGRPTSVVRLRSNANGRSARTRLRSQIELARGKNSSLPSAVRTLRRQPRRPLPRAGPRPRPRPTGCGSDSAAPRALGDRVPGEAASGGRGGDASAAYRDIPEAVLFGLAIKELAATRRRSTPRAHTGPARSVLARLGATNVMTLAPRAVVIHRRHRARRTPCAPRHRGQAAFFLTTRGRSIDDVVARSCPRTGTRSGQRGDPIDWRRGTVERADLARFLFAPDDVIVIVGQTAWSPTLPSTSAGSRSSGSTRPGQQPWSPRRRILQPRRGAPDRGRPHQRDATSRYARWSKPSPTTAQRHARAQRDLPWPPQPPDRPLHPPPARRAVKRRPPPDPHRAPALAPLAGVVQCGSNTTVPAASRSGAARLAGSSAKHGHRPLRPPLSPRDSSPGHQR